MKVQKIFTLDLAIVERLKDTSNASALINSLLKDHFSQDLSNFDNEMEQKQAVLTTLKKKARHFLEKFV